MFPPCHSSDIVIVTPALAKATLGFIDQMLGHNRRKTKDLITTWATLGWSQKQIFKTYQEGSQ